MNKYRIKITRPGRNSQFAIVTTPDLNAAEYHAVDVLILGKHAPLDDHFKMSYIPFIRSSKRTATESYFQFYSRMLTSHKETTSIEIRQDDKAISYSVDAREYDEDIFSLWPYQEYEEQEKRRLAVAPSFFTSEDVTFFSSVAGKKFTSVTDEFIQVGEELRKRIYDKTKYWAELMRDYNYTTEFRYDWQIQKKIRYYSWARISPTKKSPNVFFTVGVGSRLDEIRGEIYGLVYKLDCRRDSLTDEQCDAFDQYILSNAPEIHRVEIPSSDLKDSNWESLAELTVNFLKTNEHHYWMARRLVEGGVSRKRILARVCWNTNAWEYPSGPRGKSRLTKTHERDRGYGLEEWLFHTIKQIDGYHYSFLQGFHAKGDQIGHVYDVKLYAFFDAGHRKKQYWIGHIQNVEVLTPQQAAFALEEYKRRGWYDEMTEQLREHKINGFSFVEVSEDKMFNIRFRVSSDTVERYPQPIPIAEDDRIGNKHYTVTEAVTRTQQTTFDPFEGSDQPEDEESPAKTTINAAFQGKERVMRLLHRDIQQKIRRQLMHEYKGTGRKVKKEFDTELGTSIDIVVKEMDGTLTLYEIKTALTAILCIREALGQLIEYCYYPSQKLGSTLIIVGPHSIDTTVRLYMSHLRKELNLQLYYQGYNLDTGLLGHERA